LYLYIDNFTHADCTINDHAPRQPFPRYSTLHAAGDATSKRCITIDHLRR